jgi:4-coumarate--CoA ligase
MKTSRAIYDRYKLVKQETCHGKTTGYWHFCHSTTFTASLSASKTHSLIVIGLTCLIMQSCHRGFELVVMSKFEIERFCQIIQDFKITFVYMVPPIVLALAKHPIVDKYDLSSIRMVNSGAAPLTRELIEQVNKRLPLPIKQGYGLSETSPTTHTLNWEDWNKIYGSVGKLLPNLSTKYVDENGREVPMGQTGEICLKGPNVFLGYLNKPDLTKASFTDDGYFKTGDIGYQDEAGNLFITDRVKELIKYKGFQVAPAELEGILLDNSLVDDAAVVGVQDESQATELPRAYIVAKTGVAKNDDTKRQIAEFLHAKVAQHKKLRGGIYFVDEIPKSPSGKILRRLLRDQATAESKTPKAKL